jgi:hypothetical protein
MAEVPRQLTQAEIDRILFQQKMNMPPQSIQNLSRNVSGAVTPVAPNFAQMAAGGASRVGQFLNQILPNAQQVVAANPLNLERLFPTTNAQPQVTIPTGFNFAPKQDTMGGVIPGGLQSQQVDMNQLLRAIQPADMLGVSSAERVYTDVGMGKAPKPMDVVDTLALGAGGVAALRNATKASIAAGKYAAPEVGRMAEQYAVQTGLLNPLTAYHGSPYSFENFDISKVGTGEGAQAYGHGIYFAEAPGVARGYQMALGQKAGEITTINGKPIEQVYEQIYNKANRLPTDKAAVEYQKAEMLEKMMLDTPPAEVISYAKDIGADPSVIKWLETDIAPKTKFPGSFYKVDIPDKLIETFLDWDKPLSKQKDLVSKITPEALGLEYKQLSNGNHAYVNADGKPFWILQKGGTRESFDNRWKESLLMQNSGGELYKALNQGLDNAAKTSAALNKAGIQGIKYLDQNSRADGKGTRNFVVFDPSSVKMLERNNEPAQGLLK